MNEAVETIQYRGHEIEIFYDEGGESPRNWDNLTEIHYHSNSYELGDTNHTDIDEYNAMLRTAKRQGDIIIPMFAYIHSGVCLSLASFHGRLPQGHAEFDSGRAGTVIVRRKVLLDNYGKTRMTEALRKRAYEIAESDITTLNQYFAGDVYGYVIDDEDSCWGYYGTEYCIDEAKSIVDCIIKHDIKEHCNKVKQWIKHKVGLLNRYSESFV